MEKDKKFFEIDIIDISIDGKGIGFYNNKICYVVGALPGEKVKFKVVKQKKDYLEGIVTEIITPSNLRINYSEDHFLSCSPWQILSYTNQVEYKRKIIKKIFQKFAQYNFTNRISFTECDSPFGYRNKIEFSFKKHHDGKIYLAFHERGSYKNKHITEKGCILANEKINQTALIIQKAIQNYHFEEHDLKSITIRYSYYEDKVISLLLFRKYSENILKLIKDFENLNEIKNIIVGLSSPLSPVSSIEKVLFKKGDDYLMEKLNNYIFKYSIESFFQNNVRIFEKAIKVINKYIEPDDNVLELYCGVGSIGISLAKNAKNVLGVEITKIAVNNANYNAKINNILNYKAIAMPSEKLEDDYFNDINTIILDPPRNGIHKTLRKKILSHKPQKIIYLSCNPITQATDFYHLKEVYDIKYIHGFDFYPNTPHIENLIILEKNERFSLR